MAGSFLKDVQYRETKSATCVHVPTPQAGTYIDDGVKQAVCATLWLPKGRMTPNKEQDGENMRGWCVLQPDHLYTVSWSARENPSVHADTVRRKLKLTGAQIVAANEEFGRPAIERQRAKKTGHEPTPAQLRLFDDNYVPTYRTEPEEGAMLTKPAPEHDVRTPITTDDAWMHDPNLFYDHDIEF